MDYGLPFLHARSGEFGEALNDLEPSGKVVGWPVDVREPRLACQPESHRPGIRRMARRDGVAEFPRYLARDVDVRLGERVVTVSESDEHVAVRLASGERLEAPFLVLACPLRTSLDLAEPVVCAWPAAAEKLARLRAIEPVPTLTVIAAYDLGALDVPFHIWYPIQTTMLHIISHDSSKRESPTERVLVLHARPRYSAERLADPPEEWRDELLWELAELMGKRAAEPRWSETQAWPHARLRQRDLIGLPVVFESPRGGRVALAGEGFATDPGLEGAYMSGISLGEQIGTLPAVREGRV